MARMLFIGGPGLISASTAEDLLAEGHEVVFLCRSEPRREDLAARGRVIRGDRREAGVVEAAVREARPDVVLDFVCFDPAEALAVARAVQGRVWRHVFVSTVDVYGYPLGRIPMREDDPWREPRGGYAERKKACEVLLREALGRTLVIVRPAYSLGDRFLLSPLRRDGGRYLVPRLRAGRPVLVPGDGTTLLHASVAANTGRMIARLAVLPAATGRDVTCGHPEAMTHDDYVRLVARVAGAGEPWIVHVPSDVILRSEDEVVLGERLLQDLTGHNVAFAMDRFLGLCPRFAWTTTLEEAVEAFVARGDALGWPDPAEPIFEDRLLAAYRRAVETMSG